MFRFAIAIVFIFSSNILFAYSILVETALVQTQYQTELGLCMPFHTIEMKKRSVELKIGGTESLRRAFGSFNLKVPNSNGKIQVIVSTMKGREENGKFVNRRGIQVIDFYNNYHTLLGNSFSHIGDNERHNTLSGEFALLNTEQTHLKCGVMFYYRIH
ncbi:hypothetical protein OAB57_00315 [Bacteriovoracaceae bacterium]|nr:hypothetical protein [Bacteriovoracaceae bacterium]